MVYKWYKSHKVQDTHATIYRPKKPNNKEGFREDGWLFLRTGNKIDIGSRWRAMDTLTFLPPELC